MRLLATSACFTLFLATTAIVPALASHTPATEDNAQIANARWLSSVERAQQQADDDALVTGSDQPQQGEIQDIDVKMTPTDIYIIRWYTDQ